MKTNYSRRDVIAVAAYSSPALAAHHRWRTQPDGAKLPPAAQDAQSSAIKTRTASCNCGQLRVTCTGPDPDRVVMCNCYLCQKQTGSPFSLQARFPNEQVTIEGKSTAWKFPIEGAKPVTYRTCAGTDGIATNSAADVVTSHFCPDVRVDRLLLPKVRSRPDRRESRRLRRPDVSAADGFRLRRVPASLGDEHRGSSDAAGASQIERIGVLQCASASVSPWRRWHSR